MATARARASENRDRRIQSHTAVFERLQRMSDTRRAQKIGARRGECVSRKGREQGSRKNTTTKAVSEAPGLRSAHRADARPLRLSVSGDLTSSIQADSFWQAAAAKDLGHRLSSRRRDACDAACRAADRVSTTCRCRRCDGRFQRLLPASATGLCVIVTRAGAARRSNRRYRIQCSFHSCVQ